MPKLKILDGAMGSALISNGVTLPKHIWSAKINTTNPNLITELHKKYINLGCNYITTNTFRTTPRAYCKQFPKATYNVNYKNAYLSFKAAINSALSATNNKNNILGSIAPLEDCYQPKLFPGYKTAYNEYSQIVNWFMDENINTILLETMNSIKETISALEAINFDKQTVWVSFILKDSKHLLSNDKLIDALQVLNEYKVKTFLINCTPLYITKLSVDTIVDKWSGSWGIYPNLGLGTPSPTGNIKHIHPMSTFLSVINYAIEAGASIIGGCCGSKETHIKNIIKLKMND